VIDPDTLDWAKMDGLIPAIAQDSVSGEVRMLGYCNRDALDATIRTRVATFFSRSRGALWVKGETSGNRLELVDIRTDCDRDSILLLVRPHGPTCHLGTASCFGGEGPPGVGFVATLAEIIVARATADPAQSYTARLFADGVKRIAQKVGEEGVETALAAVAGGRAELESEAADLVFHLTLLLEASGSSWEKVVAELRRRHLASSATASS
jgi:phosphoribosyl-ATP pyrophosphohydrolase/phosphoribosyl-AMP cyclohydrolase